eukprot:TRINITY_DN577_c0_g1_i3.p1 TRINITY_DN577_c0_g1~~TRINITY_DN577_c0_g1_i3.p1  ORF type:complete len:207 (+),score=22.68 TRINITY_DN577_c0_g1_i3:358-978(+)
MFYGNLSKGNENDVHLRAENIEGQCILHRQHSLQSTYTFWCEKPKTATESYGENIKMLGSFSTVEGFWGFYNHMKRPADLTFVSSYHLFREGVRPLWEDPSNCKGGRWKARVRKYQISKVWEDLQFALIGERFDVGDEITGISVSCKASDYAINVWTRGTDEEPKNKIRFVLRALLPPSPGSSSSEPDFRPHSLAIEYSNAKQGQK